MLDATVLGIGLKFASLLGMLHDDVLLIHSCVFPRLLGTPIPSSRAGMERKSITGIASRTNRRLSVLVRRLAKIYSVCDDPNTVTHLHCPDSVVIQTPAKRAEGLPEN